VENDRALLGVQWRTTGLYLELAVETTGLYLELGVKRRHNEARTRARVVLVIVGFSF